MTFLLNVLGAVSVITALGGAGFVVARSYSERPRVLRSLQAALTMLVTEITYAATPLPEALERIARHSPSAVAEFALSVANGLESGDGASTAEAWRQAVYEQRGRWSLTGSDEDVLLDLGGYLGRSLADDQEKHLRLALTQLARRQDEAEADAVVQTRLWRYLGLCVAGLIVLLLY